jgi:hypothetical protein
VPPTTIKNATDGAIDDVTAQKWGHAFQITEGYYEWAVNANQRDALTSGAFSDPDAASNLFGEDLQELDRAKQQGGTLVVQWGPIPRVQIVPIPENLKGPMRRQGLRPQAYGVAAEFTGPSKRSIRFADGHEDAIYTADSTFLARLLIWGEFKSDGDLGTVWYESGLYGCLGEVAVACRY